MKYLIAGLGNIGPQYENTRHNIGFDIAHALVREFGETFSVEKLAVYSNIKLKNKLLHVILPTTYMNLSGKAVKYWMDELKIPRENVLVVLDDLALDFGTIRLKKKGSDGGHNGLKSINESLQTNDYARLRFGIGSNFSQGRQVDFVLGKWNEAEQKELPLLIAKSCNAIKSFALEGIDVSMNKFN